MNLLQKIINTIRQVSDPYPETVAEVLNDDINYKKETIDLLNAYCASNPYKDQVRKLTALNEQLAKIYNIDPPILVFSDRPSAYISKPFNIITMKRLKNGTYSIVTFLHEFGHALGKNEIETATWSINLFKKCFKKYYDKLDHKGHLLVKKK